MTGDTLSLFRYRFPLGATPHNASGMASLGASSTKIASPALFDELTFKKRINEQQNTSFGQNQGLVWSSDPSLWGNQLLTKQYKFWTEPRPCMVLGLKPMGKPSTHRKNYKFLTEPRPCMVLGPKPLGKPTT